MTRPLHTIVAAQDGRFAVLRTIPVPVAEFNDLADAEIFVRAIEASGPHAKAPEPDEATPPPADPRPQTPPAPAPQAAPLSNPTDATWEMAFARLRDGEKMSVVAETMGLAFTQLRGRWAARRRTEKAGAEVVPAPAAGTALVAAVKHELTGGDDAYSRPPKRSRLLDWSADEDAEVASANPLELPALAEKLGRSVTVLKARRDTLERQVAKEISNV
jgi:hypothetical protein